MGAGPLIAFSFPWFMQADAYQQIGRYSQITPVVEAGVPVPLPECHVEITICDVQRIGPRQTRVVSDQGERAVGISPYNALLLEGAKIDAALRIGRDAITRRSFAVITDRPL